MTEKILETLKNRLEKLRAEKRTFREKHAFLKKEGTRLKRELRDTRRLLELLPGPVLLIQEERITYANENSQKMLGYEGEELVDKPYLLVVHPEWRKEIGERHKRRLAGRPVPNQYEACLVSKNGERQWCEVRVAKVLLSGRRTFLVNLVRLNERKALEREKTKSRKLEALARISQGMHQEIAGWFRRLENETLFSGDNREPETPNDKGKEEIIKDVLNNGRRFLKDLAWLGGLENASEAEISYDLRKVVKEVVNQSKAKWSEGLESKKSPVRIKSYLRTLPPLLGRPEAVREVLAGMVENAVEALPKGGSIYITTEESGGFACIYIQDNGHGIAPELQEMIYDPFFTTRGPKKKGLGLSRAFSVVYGSGGDISLRSRKGEGAAFTVRLPLPPEDVPRKAATPRKRITDAHILVVSEQDLLRDLLFRLFTDQGSRVSAAVTGGEVLKALSKNGYDLLMVDMEHMDGDMKGVLRNARKNHPQLQVVAINVDGDAALSRKSEPKWADVVVGKPLELKKVRALVRELLAGKGRPR